MSKVKCPKCGAAISVDHGVHFKRCEYCESMVFVDRSGVMFYYVLPFRLGEDKIPGTFKRWAAGSTTAKGLETGAMISSLEKKFFPVYMFKRNAGGSEQIHIRPARGTMLPGMRYLSIPGGDIKIFDKDFDPRTAEVMDVDIPMDRYLEDLPGDPKEQALVYFPVYLLTYAYEGNDYHMMIEGGSGVIHSPNHPAKSSAPYGVVAALGFILSLAGAVGGTAYHPVIWGLVPVAFVAALGAGFHVARDM